MRDGGHDFTLIRADRLIDGNGSAPVERGAVLLEGDTIAAVGAEGTVVPPEGARVEERVYEGATVMPGLVDCHVHLNGMGDGRAGDELTTLPDEVLALQSARNARAHLYAGVTTVRDCGAKQRTTFLLRQAIEMGITVGPTLVLTGRPIAIVGGHLSYFGIEATGPDECRAAVRQLVKEGADFVKITATGGSTRTSIPERPSFDVDELKAICDEIHKFGKHAAAHCVSSQAMLNCLDAGIDTIIHARHREPDGSWRYREDVVERMVEQGVMANCNLGGSTVRRRELSAKAETGELSPAEQAELDSAMNDRDDYVDAIQRMRAAGVRLASGSDSSWGRYPMGLFHWEVEAHVDAGMTPMEAIVSATSDSAKSCWVDDRVGTLEPGKRADVLVVEGDPSRDITALGNTVDVFLGGSRVDRANLV